MGRVNRELATGFHSARVHAQELCALLERTPAPAGIAGAPLAELSRLVRLQWRTELRTVQLEWTARRAAEEADRERAHSAQLTELAAHLAGRLEHLENLERHQAVLTAELERSRALERTRRVRAVLALGRVGDRARAALHGDGS